MDPMHAARASLSPTEKRPLASVRPDSRTREGRADIPQVLNRHPAEASSRKSPKSGPSASPGRQTADQADGGAASTLRGSFRVGVSEDKNKKCRRTMEDAHSFVYDFAGIRGQGYFAVFDGHAGKHAAEWCGQHFHKVSFALRVRHSSRG